MDCRSTVPTTGGGTTVDTAGGKLFAGPLESRTGHARRRTAVALGVDQNAPTRPVVVATLRGVDPTEDR